MDALTLENKIRKFIRSIGIHAPHIDPTLMADYLLGLDYSEDPNKPSLAYLKVGDLVENKLSGKQGVVYELGNREDILTVKVRWPGDLNVVYCDNGADIYLLKKI